jgi:hypothetical protein
MKKITTILLIIVLIFIFSCDKSDSEAQDPIVGKWEYSTQYENDIQSTQNDCKPSTIEFQSNGNRNDLYYDSNLSGNCVVVDNVNSTWEKTNTNTYQFNHNGDIYTETVTFENGNNKLILQSSDTDGSGNIVIYKFIYNRLY